jgi:hypothetical protein
MDARNGHSSRLYSVAQVQAAASLEIRLPDWLPTWRAVRPWDWVPTVSPVFRIGPSAAFAKPPGLAHPVSRTPKKEGFNMSKNHNSDLHLPSMMLLVK